MGEFPTSDVRLGLLLVVANVAASRDFYRDIIGARVIREFEGSFCQLELAGTLLFVVAGGGPTDDKPDITFSPPGNTNTVSSELTFRISDCQAAYDDITSRGGKFITPPMKQDWGGEIRCFLRDPDGHLLEFSQLL